jgi:hypothetical protein
MAWFHEPKRVEFLKSQVSMLYMSQAAMPPFARPVSADQEDDLKLTQKSLTREEEDAYRGDGVAAADLDQNVI